MLSINHEESIESLRKIIGERMSLGEEKKLSAKAQKVYDIWEKNDKEELRELLSVLIGEELPKETGGYPLFTVVVPVENFASHSYKIGEPVIILYDDLSARPYQATPDSEGELGVYLKPSEIRSATPEEVEKLLENLTTNQLVEIGVAYEKQHG